MVAASTLRILSFAMASGVVCAPMSTFSRAAVLLAESCPVRRCERDVKVFEGCLYLYTEKLPENACCGKYSLASDYMSGRARVVDRLTLLTIHIVGVVGLCKPKLLSLCHGVVKRASFFQGTHDKVASGVEYTYVHTCMFSFVCVRACVRCSGTLAKARTYL